MNFKEYIKESTNVDLEDLEQGAVPEMLEALKSMKTGLKHTSIEMSGVTRETVKYSKESSKNIDTLVKSLKKLWDSQA